MEKHFRVVDLTGKRNAYTVGDIHGRFDLLEKKLTEIGFDKSKDVLFAVGDLIDRGHYSARVIRYINQDWFKAVEGNHERMAVDGAFDGYYQRMHRKNGGEWFYSLSEDERYVLAREFNRLPIAIETTYKGKKYGFVHADVAGNDWKAFKHALLDFKPSPNHDRSVIDHALWSRSRPRDWFTGFNHENHEPISNVDQVFVGHNVFYEPFAIHNINYIDTGAHQTGELTVVPLDVVLPQAAKEHIVYSSNEYWG